MDCIQNITIIAPILVVGSLGTKHHFIPYRQYCYEEKIHIQNSNKCGNNCYQYYYTVKIGDELFNVPEDNAVIDYNTRTEKEKDLSLVKRDFYINKDEDPDYSKVYEEITGTSFEKKTEQERLWENMQNLKSQG